METFVPNFVAVGTDTTNVTGPVVMRRTYIFKTFEISRP